MLTAKGEKDDIVAGLEKGADDYLAKPYDPDELRARVGVGRRMVEMQAKLAEARDALAHEATHDPLTGILNRRAILDRLAQELSRAARSGKMVGVGLCDLDCFKEINDRYGHQVGDDVLCGFTRIIEANLRQCDLIGRYGGEEFLVITPEVGEPAPEGLRTITRNGSRKRYIYKSGRHIHHHEHWGFSGTGADTVDGLLSRADAALYQAKKEGRNCVSYTGLRIAADSS